MKKKIIFMIINMNIGGTEKALLNMIEEIPRYKYDITILMLEKYGDLLNSIPNDVKVEYVNEYPELKRMLNDPPIETVTNLIKEGKFVHAVNFTVINVLSRILMNKSVYFKYMLRKIPPYINKYDVAVAYAGPMDLISYFIIYKIKAKKKIQWIHFDVTKIRFDKRFNKYLYNRYDKIITASNQGKEKLKSIIPELDIKLDSYPNKIPYNLILKRANEGEGFKDNFDGTRILTVGRLSKEKGQDLVIPVLARLRKMGYKVRWYCIGEGKERAEYEKLIQKYDVEDDFILLGAYTNPYPFMKQCDIYVQPSRHEGYCITLGEVKCFNIPIISTEFTGAHEQISHLITGLIVKQQNEEIYNAVEYLLNDAEIRHKLKLNLQQKIEKHKNYVEKIVK